MHKDIGSVVIIGGSMETGSYLLVGGDKAEDTFCSTAHGSGRTMSRNAAKRQFRGEQLQKDMEKRGILVKTVSFSGGWRSDFIHRLVFLKALGFSCPGYSDRFNCRCLGFL